MEKIHVKIFRYDPSKDKEPRYDCYEIPFQKEMRVLDILHYIRENIDSTLAYRYSCLRQRCGACAVIVNGKAVLACLEPAQKNMVIEPLHNFPIIRDLVVDKKIMDKKLEKIPAFSRSQPPKQIPEPLNPTQFEILRQVAWCIECSICHSVCPAAIDERFLGPVTLTANYRFISDPRDEYMDERLKVMTDNIWLCTSCNSCTLSCPQEVNPSSYIVEERNLIVETGIIPRTVMDVLTNVMKYHNPIGRYPSKRMEWTEGMKIKTFPTITKADVLYFVCCLTAYDTRYQKIARSMASLFDHLGVNFATLGVEEWCCGDHILRLGEKGLFETLAEHNLSMFEKFDADRIVTLSPHCYNTFKNDKPYSDAELDVQHYTQFLAEAIEKGKLKLSKAIKKRVAYHDPCFLGKRNKIFEAPRQILESINGIKLVEMKRTKENSFCCGGGAGRVWIEDAPPEKRPSINRLKEALELNVEIIATACPFCISTLEDAAKVLDVQDKIAIKDILELLKEAT